jgi:hypothetical protein
VARFPYQRVKARIAIAPMMFRGPILDHQPFGGER